MKTQEAGYWFRAKRYGWGWGLPLNWKGWVVIVAFYLLITVGAFTLLPWYGKSLYLVFSATLAAGMLGICYLKGEPPRWRWGGE